MSCIVSTSRRQDFIALSTLNTTQYLKRKKKDQNFVKSFGFRTAGLPLTFFFPIRSQIWSDFIFLGGFRRVLSRQKHCSFCKIKWNGALKGQSWLMIFSVVRNSVIGIWHQWKWVTCTNYALHLVVVSMHQFFGLHQSCQIPYSSISLEYVLCSTYDVITRLTQLGYFPSTVLFHLRYPILKYL